MIINGVIDKQLKPLLEKITNIISGTIKVGSANTATVADSANTVLWSGVTNKPDTFTPAHHNQTASTITAGTFAGKVQANSTAMATLNSAQVRDIYITSSAITEGGSSSLANGTIVFSKG